MSEHRYVLDQLYTAQTALLAVLEVGNEFEQHQCAAALKHLDKMFLAREIGVKDSSPSNPRIHDL